MIESLLGVQSLPAEPVIQATLTVNLPSQAGREDWWPVRLTFTEDGILADPIFYKSNLIFTYTQAQGLIRIPADANGLAANSRVDVFTL
jgi:molybdopterin molybdotransferase